MEGQGGWTGKRYISDYEVREEKQEVLRREVTKAIRGTDNPPLIALAYEAIPKGKICLSLHDVETWQNGPYPERRDIPTELLIESPPRSSIYMYWDYLPIGGEANFCVASLESGNSFEYRGSTVSPLRELTVLIYNSSLERIREAERVLFARVEENKDRIVRDIAHLLDTPCEDAVNILMSLNRGVNEYKDVLRVFVGGHKDSLEEAAEIDTLWILNKLFLREEPGSVEANVLAEDTWMFSDTFVEEDNIVSARSWNYALNRLQESWTNW